MKASLGITDLQKLNALGEKKNSLEETKLPTKHAEDSKHGFKKKGHCPLEGA